MIFRASEWSVRDVDYVVAKALIQLYHYSGGGSSTRVYAHGLFHQDGDVCMGVAWWLPPTRVAAESVNREQWQRVLSLTRLAVVPGVPKNACSFLLSRSVRRIQQDKRFVSLVTYADESQGHTGAIYRAANWEYAGRTGANPRWVDANGRQVAVLSTKSRTKAQMEALGYVNTGYYHKHKFVKHLRRSPSRDSEMDRMLADLRALNLA